MLRRNTRAAIFGRAKGRRDRGGGRRACRPFAHAPAYRIISLGHESYVTRASTLPSVAGSDRYSHTYIFPLVSLIFPGGNPSQGGDRRASERASACVRRVSAVVLSFLCKYEYLFSCSSRGNSIGPRVRITCAGERGVCASRWNIVVCILVFLHVSSFCAANIRACCARRRAPGDRGVLRSSNIASVVFVPFYLCILKLKTTKKGIGRLTIFFFL